MNEQFILYQINEHHNYRCNRIGNIDQTVVTAREDSSLSLFPWRNHLGLITYGPYTSSIGFLESTKKLDRVDLIIRGALFTLLEFVPPIGALFSIFLLGKGVLSYIWPLYNYSVPLHNIQFNSKTIYRIATPALLVSLICTFLRKCSLRFLYIFVPLSVMVC